MNDSLHPYLGLFDTLALGLLLVIIAAFYVSLTLEAFKGTAEGRSTDAAQQKAGASVDCRSR